MQTNFRKTVVFLPMALFFMIALDFYFAQHLFPTYTQYDIKRILQIILLIWTGILLIVSAKERKSLLGLWNELPNLAHILILGIFGLGIISAIYAPIFKMAMLEVALTFLLIIFALYVAYQRITGGEVVDNLLIMILVLGIFIYEAAFFVAYFHALMFKQKFVFFPGFVNIRFFAHYLTWILPVITLPIFRLKPERRALIALVYIIAAFAWSLAIANAARGMVFGLVIGFLVAAILFRKVFYQWLFVQLRVIFSGVILYLIFFVVLVKYSGLSVGMGSIHTRLILLHDAWLMIVNHPLLGVGPMHFSYYQNPIAAHPHNSLMLIACEWGIPVVLMVLVLFICGIISWFRAFNFKSVAVLPLSSTALVIALTVSLLAGSCYSLVCGVTVTPLSQVTLALIMGWVLGIYYCDQDLLKEKKPFLSHVIFIFLILFLIFAMLIGIFPAVFILPATELKWVFMQVEKYHTHTVIFNPRFWIQGWIN